ncbi:Rossmann fold domain-containing protein [Altererythrobacter sp. Root672]|uniref:Rossmann fold domain-containing protein n=1 Tax=Altererythrobacter sp. Root672 TaxID=1736584 RepID=UPI0006FE8369|nr:hypothetical protein [Altererythrobacter sp. Root672]KRA82812.1 hypothetical protein ASD76_01600 [Altererythrobacter sp. Root672]
MTTRFVSAADLPEDPLNAAADFHTRILPELRENWDRIEEIIVSFDAAGHEHHAWRLAAIQQLAREAAPCRVNGVVVSPDHLAAAAEAINYLSTAPGITGQILTVDGKSGEND